MKRKKILAVNCILMFLVLLVTMGCGGGSSSSSSSSSSSPVIATYLGTQSPGDVWTWTLNRTNGSFNATNETAGYTYSGSLATLPNGFLILVVTSTTDPAVAVPAPAYAFEVPNTALVIKPAEADSKAIVAVAQGGCPSTDATYNWVVIPHNSWDGLVDTAYGVTSMSITGSSIDLFHNEYLINGTLDGTIPDVGYSCVGGRFEKTGMDELVGVTPSGVIVGDHGPGQGGFVGFQAPSLNIDLSVSALANKEFRGVLFKNNSSDEDTEPVWARHDGSGGIDGGHYTDFENGVESTPMVNLTFGTQSSPGVVNGTLTDNSYPSPVVENFTFMISEIDGKYFIFGIAAEGGDNNSPYNFLVMER